MERMKERTKSHVIPSVLAAIYLDLEYQVLLNKEQQTWAPSLLLIKAFCYWNTKRTACAVEKCLAAY